MDVELLEDFVLYRRRPIPISNRLDLIPKPRINMECPTCKQVRTFQMVNNYYDGFGYSNAPSDGQTVLAKYRCVSCEEFIRTFTMLISPSLDWAMKTGQFPAWSIKGNQQLEALLGDHADYYRKALICESQAYGIAAFGYYRRITEEIIDQLLDQIEALISPDERANYVAALAEVRKTRVTIEKIDLVKDLLPPILRPDNMNPLAVLHGALSEGLHAESDESCLQIAQAVRETLLFLVAQIAATQAASKSFTDGMKKLLGKKSGQGKEGATPATN